MESQKGDSKEGEMVKESPRILYGPHGVTQLRAGPTSPGGAQGRADPHREQTRETRSHSALRHAGDLASQSSHRALGASHGGLESPRIMSGSHSYNAGTR